MKDGMRTHPDPQSHTASLAPRGPIRNPDAVLQYLATMTPSMSAGMTMSLFLNADHTPVGYCQYPLTLFRQTGPAPKDIFRAATSVSTVFVILIQQHPTQETGPFEIGEDQRQQASKCALAGQLLEIPVLDYLVINNTHRVSLLIDDRDELNRIARAYVQRLANPLYMDPCQN